MSSSSKSSKKPTSSASRPYSFRPQDFGAPERSETSVAAPLREQENEDEASAEPPRHPEAPTASVVRAGPQPAPRTGEVPHRVARKEEHTILMAVPPPAQENKGD